MLSFIVLSQLLEPFGKLVESCFFVPFSLKLHVIENFFEVLRVGFYHLVLWLIISLKLRPEVTMEFDRVLSFQLLDFLHEFLLTLTRISNSAI